MSEEMSSEQLMTNLINDANEKLQWARQMASQLLEHANNLEERADKMRELAAVMAIEAQTFNDETASILIAEFPFNLQGGITDDGGESLGGMEDVSI